MDDPGAEATRTLGKLWVWLTVFYVLLMFFCNLGSEGMYAAQEGRTAILARNMLVRDNYFEMYIPGRNPYEKPIAYYWLVAGSGSLFGLGGDTFTPGIEFGVRLPSAVCAVLCVGVIALLANSVYGRNTALLTAVVLSTMMLFNTLGRLAHIDIALCLAYTAAMACFYYGYLRERKANWKLYGFYLALGIGMLLKGPVVIPLAALVVLSLMIRFRSWKLPLELKPWLGVPLFLLVGCSWYAFESLRTNWEFFDEFIVKQNFSRFTGKGSSYGGGEWMSPGYHIGSLIAGSMPWAVFAIIAAIVYWKKLIKFKMSNETFFFLVWFATGFIFFSCSALKRRDYILPLLPALAVLTSIAIIHFCELKPKFSRWWWALWAVPAALLPMLLVLNETGVIPLLARKVLDRSIDFISRQDGFGLQLYSEIFHEHLYFVMALAALLLFLSGAMVYNMVRRKTYTALVLWCLMIGALYTIYNAALDPAMNKGKSLKRFAFSLRETVPEGEILALYREFNDECVFFYDRPYYYTREIEEAREFNYVLCKIKQAKLLMNTGDFDMVLEAPSGHQFPAVVVKRKTPGAGYMELYETQSVRSYYERILQ